MNKDLQLTLRLENALRWLARFPTMSLAVLAEKFSVERDDLSAWLAAHNGGKKDMEASLIEEVKRKLGALTVTRVPKPEGRSQKPEAAKQEAPEVTKLTALRPEKTPAPAPVKLVATSDIGKWLAAQGVRIVNTINSYVVEVTPVLAAAWLKFNTGNRKPSRAKIRRFTQAMKAGKWTVNGETIKFAVSGRLIDGQSRLMALIEAGGTVTMEVRAGLPDVAQESMDCGELRKGSHMLEMAGEAHPFELAAALKMLWLRENGGWPARTPGGRRVMENAEVKPALERHMEIKESVGFVVSDGKKIKNMLPFSEAAFFHYLFGKANRELRDHFFEALIDGVGLTKLSPVYHLREKLIEYRKAWAKQRICIERSALIIKAWNLTSAGEKATKLTWSGKGPTAEGFPEIAGLEKEAA